MNAGIHPSGCGPGDPSGYGTGDPLPRCGPGDPLPGQTPQALPWVWAWRPARHAGILPPTVDRQTCVKTLPSQTLGSNNEGNSLTEHVLSLYWACADMIMRGNPLIKTQYLTETEPETEVIDTLKVAHFLAITRNNPQSNDSANEILTLKA